MQRTQYITYAGQTTPRKYLMKIEINSFELKFFKLNKSQKIVTVFNIKLLISNSNLHNLKP